jgi:hypothetical protein
MRVAVLRWQAFTGDAAKFAQDGRALAEVAIERDSEAASTRIGRVMLSTKPLEVAVLPCLSYATLAVFLGRNSNSDSTLIKSRLSLRRTGAAIRKF